MKKNIQKIIVFVTVTTPSFLLVAATPAAPAKPAAVGGFFTPPIGDGTNSTDLKTIFMNVLDVAQTIMIMASTLYLLYAGFMFVTAKGDPTRLKKAQNALLWGLVGSALILTAEVLALGIGDTVKEVFKGK